VNRTFSQQKLMFDEKVKEKDLATKPKRLKIINETMGINTIIIDS
jgi:hypothetical protein